MLMGARRFCRGASSLLGALVLLAAYGTALTAQERTGWLHTVYVDPPRGRRPPAPLIGLVDAQGRFTRLVGGDAVLRAAGGPRALEGRRVSVDGALATGVAPAPGISPALPALRVDRLRALEPAGAAGAPSFSIGAATDVRPYVMLLCKFSDQPSEPMPRSWYDAVVGPTRPNMGHYFNELSFGRLSLAGSVAVGWFTLPKPYLYYYPDGGQSLVFDKLLQDCVTAADATVDFKQYSGIIVQHNLGPDWAFGGRYTLTIDGQTRAFGVAWMPKSGTAQLAHELGHTLGFPHSSGDYGEVYDSRWDVMSNSYPFVDYSLVPPDFLQQHTIAYDKWSAGWIDAGSVLTPVLASTQSIMLLFADRAPATTGYQLVRVPDPQATSKQYLAEARRRVGYDQGVPGNAIVLHSYDGTRSEPAHVIDVDRNGDPNDAGAMWTVGESYADSIFGLTIDVDSANASGFGVTVVRGWRLRMQATGPGSITGSPNGACTARCDHIAAARGSTVSLTAVPSAGAQFLGWSGSCSGTAACTVKLDGNRAVGATFGVPLTLTSASERPRAIVGRPYADKLVATGGSATVTFAVTSGALPPGVVLASSTGVLSGQPTKEGRFEFTVTATSGTLTSARAFAVSVVRPLAILTDASLPRAVKGTSFTTTLSADGGTGSVRWSVSTGALPAGLVLEPATGKLAGTPSAAGAFEFTVLAASDTLRDTRKFTISVVAPVTITSAAERRAAVMGAAYADTMRATGGDGVFDWRLTAGELPAGVTLEAGGVVRGRPATSGSFRFTATVASVELTAQREFTLVVSKPALASNAVLDALLGGSAALTADERSFLDLLGNHNGRLDVGDVRAWLVDAKALQPDARPGEALAALTRLEAQRSLSSRPAAARAPGATTTPRERRP
jgi:hypothetical protein